MKKTEKSTVKSTSSATNLTVTNEAIRERAYDIFLKTGSHDQQANWIKAENEHNLMIQR